MDNREGTAANGAVLVSLTFQGAWTYARGATEVVTESE